MASSRNIGIVVAAFYVLIILAFARLPQLTSSSEAREFQVAHSISQTGEWILPTRNGVIPSKPPLYHWATAAVGELRGGVTVAVARFTSAISAGVVIFLVYLLTGAIVRATSNQSTSSRTSEVNYPISPMLLSALVLATSYIFIELSGAAMVDMLLTLTVTAAAFVMIYPLTLLGDNSLYPDGLKVARSVANPVTWVERGVFWTLLGLGALTKGPLGIFLPIIIVTTVYVAVFGSRRGVSLVFKPSFGWIMLFLIVGFWNLAAYLQWGDSFIERQLIFENWHRFFGGERVNTERWWFYLPSFLRSVFPWSVLFIVFLMIGFRSEILTTQAKRIGQLRNDRLLWVGAIWVVAGLLVFSLSSGKRHSYLLPLVPGVAIFIGAAYSRLVQDQVNWAGKFFSRVTKVVGGNAILMLMISLLFLQLLTTEWSAKIVARFGAASWITESVRLASSYLEECLFVVAVTFSLVAILVILCRILHRKNPFETEPVHAMSSFMTLSALFSATIFLCLGIKGDLKDFRGQVIQLGDFLNFKEPIIVLRAPGDENFDITLAYMQSHLNHRARLVTVPELSKGGSGGSYNGELVNPVGKLREQLSNCASQQFLVRHSDLPKILEYEPNEQLLPIGRIRQRLDQIRNREDRDLVLVQCRTLLY